MDLRPHPFSLRQLQYAVAVAKTLSFREAAALCHVAQPSLSAQLAQLEDALSVKLFERDRRRVLLTSAGRALVERASQLLLDSDALMAAARQVANPLAGTLRIGVIPTISPYLLPSVTPKLRASFEHLTIGWIEDKTASLLAQLEIGDLDAALLALEAPLGDLERLIIAQDPFVLVAPPEHPLARKSGPLTLRDLRGVEILLLDDGHCFREQALSVCGTAKARELEFRATSLSTLVQMVAAGAGVTLLPSLAVPTELRRAKLHKRKFAPPVPHRTIALVFRKQSPLAAPLAAVSSVIEKGYKAAISA